MVSSSLVLSSNEDDWVGLPLVLLSNEDGVIGSSLVLSSKEGEGLGLLLVLSSKEDSVSTRIYQAVVCIVVPLFPKADSVFISRYQVLFLTSFWC